MRVAVLGAGAWGTALAIAFARKHDVLLWARDAAQAALIQQTRRNDKYLPEATLPDGISITADLSAAIANTNLLLLAGPTASLRPLATQVINVAPTTPLLWACKGFEHTSVQLPHQIMESLNPRAAFGALSGPSFAAEVAQGLPAAVVIASRDENFALDTARTLSDERLRCYANADLTGVEIGGALKNVIAIAAGISDGLNLGLNARAALITRGLAEMTRLTVAVGGQPQTLMGLAGLGDLVLTCTGALSRNRTVGLELAKGRTLDDILSHLGHVAEGVRTAESAVTLARSLDVELPISEAVADVIAGRQRPAEAVKALLLRETKAE